MAKVLRDTASGVGKAATGTAGRATGAAKSAGSTARKTAEQGSPGDLLRQSVQNLAGTLAQRAVSSLSGGVSGAAGRLNEYAEGQGGGNLLAALTGVEKLSEGASPMRAAMSAGVSKLGKSVKDTVSSAKDAITGGGGKGGKGKKLKLANIVEHIDIGAEVELVYDQWTQFAEFPKFTKKLEQVEQVSDEKLSWTGRVFWSRRTWESTILEQVPFERIIWRSKGAKGYIDGAVTFHELGPHFTRVLVVLEYHPQGLFEKTANIWRAAGRRCRLELKHFERYVMTEAVLRPDDIVGWHGEIRDGEVVEDDESARRREQEEAEGEDTEGEGEGAEDEGAADEEPTDEDEEDEEADEEEADEDEDEERGAEEGGPDDEEAEDSTEDEDREARPSRRARTDRRAATPRRSRTQRGART
ncbi:SRPBCC family protein [Nocardia rhamnosiphila]|uniref:SRPBCC family protein n=1 Tax=Nocardia rhamnosiphila TaxID=426716 RepID=A0ABV2WM05_9NOCA|nr:SRPBCC family protein [Nocardia rhamnosiphila]